MQILTSPRVHAPCGWRKRLPALNISARQKLTSKLLAALDSFSEGPAARRALVPPPSPLNPPHPPAALLSLGETGMWRWAQKKEALLQRSPGGSMFSLHSDVLTFCGTSGRDGTQATRERDVSCTYLCIYSVHVSPLLARKAPRVRGRFSQALAGLQILS